MIIDKNYTGATPYLNGIKIDGDLVTSESLTITCDLYVTGYLSSGGSIISGGDLISSGGDIISGGDLIISGGSIRSGGDLISGGDISSGGNLRYVSISVFGVPTEVFIQIKLFYSITITDTIIKIGCEKHTIDKWKNFTDREILEMDGHSGLQFWKEYKNMIMGIVDSNKKQ